MLVTFFVRCAAQSIMNDRTEYPFFWYIISTYMPFVSQLMNCCSVLRVRKLRIERKCRCYGVYKHLKGVDHLIAADYLLFLSMHIYRMNRNENLKWSKLIDARMVLAHMLVHGTGIHNL